MPGRRNRHPQPSGQDPGHWRFDRVEAPSDDLQPSPATPIPSVVIAAGDDTARLDHGLRSVLGQADPGTELPAIANLDPPASFPGAGGRTRLIWGRSDALVPQLWTSGIAAAKGEGVAVTTAHITPELGWVRAVRIAFHAETCSDWVSSAPPSD